MAHNKFLAFPNWLKSVYSCFKFLSLRMVIYFFHRNFPSLYYTTKYTIPGSNSSIVLVMIDTVTLCGNSYDTELISIPPQGPENPKHAEDQWAWIETQLKNTVK